MQEDFEMMMRTTMNADNKTIKMMRAMMNTDNKAIKMMKNLKRLLSF